MYFNADKGKAMLIDEKYRNFKYKSDQELDNFKQERDLGVIINCNLKVIDQCIATSKKANMMLELISRNFDHKTSEVMKKLYTVFVRPQLEYAIQLAYSQ